MHTQGTTLLGAQETSNHAADATSATRAGGAPTNGGVGGAEMLLASGEGAIGPGGSANGVAGMGIHQDALTNKTTTAQ